MKQPLVSVVLPVYNAGAYIAAAVKSMLTQTFPDFELLLFDDGSTDRSRQVVERFARRDNRIHFFCENHRGYVPWLNEGILQAKGKFIARMDADDIALPDRLHQQVTFLQAHSEYVAVGSNCLLIDPEGWPLGRLNQPIEHGEIDARHLRGQGGALAHPSVMFRRDIAMRLGGYRLEYQYAEDLDLWLRMAEIGCLANLPAVLMKYRQHFQSVSHLQRQRQLELVRQILDETYRRRGLPPSRLDHLPTAENIAALDVQQFWAERAAKEGFLSSARKHFWQVLKQRPKETHLWGRLLDATMPPLGTWLQKAWHIARPNLGFRSSATPQITISSRQKCAA
jgi:glycosyltransferase involved in cell wall biosynthesis